ncbi:hypothetical protein ACE6H2_017226 [Prunus campanulata]
MGNELNNVKCVRNCGRRFVSHETLMGCDFVGLKNRDVHELVSHVDDDVLQVGVKQYAKGVRILLSFYSPFDKVKNIVELLSLIQQHVDIIPISDVKYAYSTVLGDLKVLKATIQVMLISSSYALEDMVYPSDPLLHRPTIESAQSSTLKQHKNKKTINTAQSSKTKQCRNKKRA